MHGMLLGAAVVFSLYAHVVCDDDDDESFWFMCAATHRVDWPSFKLPNTHMRVLNSNNVNRWCSTQSFIYTVIIILYEHVTVYI